MLVSIVCASTYYLIILVAMSCFLYADDEDMLSIGVPSDSLPELSYISSGIGDTRSNEGTTMVTEEDLLFFRCHLPTRVAARSALQGQSLDLQRLRGQHSARPLQLFMSHQ